MSYEHASKTGLTGCSAIRTTIGRESYWSVADTKLTKSREIRDETGLAVPIETGAR